MILTLRASASFIPPCNKYLDQKATELNHSDPSMTTFSEIYSKMISSSLTKGQHKQKTKTAMGRTYRILLDMCFVNVLSVDPVTESLNLWVR